MLNEYKDIQKGSGTKHNKRSEDIEVRNLLISVFFMSYSQTN